MLVQARGPRPVIQPTSSDPFLVDGVKFEKSCVLLDGPAEVQVRRGVRPVNFAFYLIGPTWRVWLPVGMLTQLDSSRMWPKSKSKSRNSGLDSITILQNYTIWYTIIYYITILYYKILVHNYTYISLSISLSLYIYLSLSLSIYTYIHTHIHNILLYISKFGGCKRQDSLS